MIKLFRKYNKKILAVVGVLLMIAFIVPSVAKRGSHFGGSGTVGYIGEQKLTGDELRYAHTAWELLRGRELSYTPDQAEPITLMDVQLAKRLIAGLPSAFASMGLQSAVATAHQMFRQLDSVDFLLLLKEADRMNIQVSDEEVQRALAEIDQYHRALNARLPEVDPDLRQRVVRDWLRVFEAYARVADAAKVSRAMGVHQVAREEQEVALNLVEFKAVDFKSKVAPPTTQQVNEFFQKHRELDPQASPSGFGYRYPDRVKLEYIRVPLANLKKQVTDEDTYEFWKRNQELFPTTQPASTQPASTQPAAVAAASTQPTTRPWEEVKDQIRDRIAMDLAFAMTKQTLQSLSADYSLHRQAPNEPSSAGVPIDNRVYLRRIAERIQGLKDSRGVLPEIVQEGDWLSKQDLANLPGIGQSSFQVSGRQPIPFADFAMERAAAFLTDAQQKLAQRNQVQLLNLYQPSFPFRDPQGNYYIFRLTAADPAHAPKSIEGLESKVRDDWITAQAYELAREAARKFLEAAKAQGLKPAADAAGPLPVVSTGLFYNDARYPIPNYPVVDQAKPAFVEGAFALLQQRLKSGNEHPIDVIELPKASTVVVAQLEQAKPAIEHGFFPQRVAETQRMLEGQHDRAIAQSWFSPDEIRKRMQYKSAEGGDAPPPPRAPAPPPIL